MKTVAIRELVFRDVSGFLMLLVGHGCNGKRWRVWEKVKWMVYHSNNKYLLQRLLLAIYRFTNVPMYQSLWVIFNTWIVFLIQFLIIVKHIYVSNCHNSIIVTFVQKIDIFRSHISVSSMNYLYGHSVTFNIFWNYCKKAYCLFLRVCLDIVIHLSMGVISCRRVEIQHVLTFQPGVNFF